MKQFLKAQTSSLAATGADFLTTVFLREICGVWYFLANVVGVVTGGCTNFLINKDWVFAGESERLMRLQARRYLLVWTGNLLLNAGGVWLIMQTGLCNYITAKATVSLVVGFSYNYFLQKNYVFK